MPKARWEKLTGNDESVGCEHFWYYAFPDKDEDEPVERFCKLCSQLEREVDDDLFLGPESGYNERRGYESAAHD